MSREKQIIEIKECIDSVYGADCAYFDVDGFAIANKIYNAGYRKQSDNTVEVVRCKDCVFCEEGQGASIYCRLHDTRFERNGFCSYGKMKGGAE